MSELTATQIPRPSDEQAFERCMEILWRCILKDKNAKLYGRRGQKQRGVDIIGIRDRDPQQIVGVQCKLVNRLSIMTPDLECAPGPGQVMYKELTGDAGLSEDESHGKAPHIQYRIQAAGGAGVFSPGRAFTGSPGATTSRVT